MPQQVIKISSARQHNLKNLHLEIPREKLVVITGLSGSGKSSLAIDTLYAKGQRRYVESLSAYAWQFLNQMPPVAITQIHFFTRTRSSIFLRQEYRRNASVGAISLFLRKPSSIVALVSSQKSTAGLLAYQLSPRLTVVWMALRVVRHSRDR